MLTLVAALFPHATSGLRELARWPAGQRTGSLRRARARSLKRVNGCDTRCSSVRVTMYYELNNVMIGTAPVTRRISCVPCNGCLETRELAPSLSWTIVESIFFSTVIRFHRLLLLPTGYKYRYHDFMR